MREDLIEMVLLIRLKSSQLVVLGLRIVILYKCFRETIYETESG